MSLREKQGEKGRERERDTETERAREGREGEAQREGSAAAVSLSELSGYSCGPESSSDSLDQY